MRNLGRKLARLIAPAYFLEVERKSKDIDAEVGRRVAEIMSKMDPFEPLLKEFHGVFGEEFERVEEKLDARSSLLIETWGYQQRDDPSFKFMCDWIMNSQGNETLKRAPVSTERLLYGRAQIAGIVLLKNEVKRLASLYEERLRRGKEDFNHDLTAE